MGFIVLQASAVLPFYAVIHTDAVIVSVKIIHVMALVTMKRAV